MALTTLAASGGPILTPEDVQALVVRPLIAEAVATQVSTTVTTRVNQTRFPVVVTDPTTGWTQEGNIASDADVDELIVQPRKLAGLAVLSNELVNDSDPSALQVVGDGLVRDLRTRLDAAYFGVSVANGPNGIEGLTGVTTVTGGTITDLDAFAEAVSEAELVGQQITSWVAHPNTALTLMQLKDEPSTSNRPLLGPDATSPTKKSVLGIPLFSAPGCSPNYIYGIPRATAYVVIRVPASVEVDRSVKFTSDQTAVRCILRASSGWPHPASIIRNEHRRAVTRRGAPVFLSFQPGFRCPTSVGRRAPVRRNGLPVPSGLRQPNQAITVARGEGHRGAPTTKRGNSHAASTEDVRGSRMPQFGARADLLPRA